MKIISWNCNMAFRNKCKKIMDLKPDLLVLQECEGKEKLLKALELWNVKDIFWFGENPNKGLALISFIDTSIEIDPNYNNTFRYIIPLVINLEIPIRVFLVWAMPFPKSPKRSYIHQVWCALQHYQIKTSDNTIMIGDFNSHIRWDKERKEGNHSDVVANLSNHKVLSLYHLLRNIAQGEEKEPTFFMYKKETLPYHLDYCFVSNHLIQKQTTIQVGRYTDWITLSDHMPLIINNIAIN